MFDFLTNDVLFITANFGHSFDILKFNFLLKPPQPVKRLFMKETVYKFRSFALPIQKFDF